jgi:hypothetical protein
MRLHGFVVEVPFDVLGKRAGRAIATLGFGRGRPGDDAGEVAAQLARCP